MCSFEDSFVSLTRRLTQQVHRTRLDGSGAGARHTSAMVLVDLHGDDQRTLVSAPKAEATVIAIDVSSSMSEAYRGAKDKLAAAKAAAITFVVTKASMSPEDHLGLVSFDDQARVVLPCQALREHRKDLIRAVQELQIGGGTDIAAPLIEARVMLAATSPDLQPRVALITDGHGGEPLDIAREMQNEGIVLDVIGIGDTPDRVNEPLLRKVASVVDGQSRYIFIRDMRSLLEHTSSISRHVSDRTVKP